MRVPSSFLKGSGSLELAGDEPGRVTGQSAPSSSTAAAAMLAALAVVVVLATTVSAPAIASAATASMTTAQRILERPELMITRALLPGRWRRRRRSMITDVGYLRFRGTISLSAKSRSATASSSAARRPSGADRARDGVGWRASVPSLARTGSSWSGSFPLKHFGNSSEETLERRSTDGQGAMTFRARPMDLGGQSIGHGHGSVRNIVENFGATEACLEPYEFS